MSVAGVAHPVERHLAKVEVASSSLVTRSIEKADCVSNRLFQLYSPFGEFYCFAVILAYASGIALRAVSGEYNTTAKQYHLSKYHFGLPKYH